MMGSRWLLVGALACAAGLTGAFVVAACGDAPDGPATAAQQQTAGAPVRAAGADTHPGPAARATAPSLSDAAVDSAEAGASSPPAHDSLAADSLGEVYEKLLAAEQPDPGWSAKREATLGKAFSAAFGASAVDAVHCAATACRVELQLGVVDAAPVDLVMQLTSTGGNRLVFVHRAVSFAPSPDGKTILFYITRLGYTVPKPDGTPSLVDFAALGIDVSAIPD